MDCFLPIRFRTSVQLTPSELNVDFHQALLARLRKDLEGVCSRFGYIRPNSVEIIKRSVGQFVKQHFNGHIRFELVCKAEVCNPPQGFVVKAVVRVKNEMGVLAESSIEMDGKNVPVLDIIVPLRAAGIVSEIPLEHVQVGDEIYVAVLSKRYQLRDKKISVIGRAVQRPLSSTVNADEDQGGLEDGIDKASIGSFDDEEPLDEETEEIDGASDDDFTTAPVKRTGGNASVPGVTKSIFVGGDEEEDADAEEEEEALAEEEDDPDMFGVEEDDFYEEGGFDGYGDDD